MKRKVNSILEVVNPKSNSTIMIYDLHASETGALAVLIDLYQEILNYKDKSIKWFFVVSTPQLESADNILVYNYPEAKKSWFHRLFFDKIYSRKIVNKINPDKVVSLQNNGLDFFKGEEIIYLHFAHVTTDYKYKLFRDELKLWVYQHILKFVIYRSLKRSDKIIVQTESMKNDLSNKSKIKKEKIYVIKNNTKYVDVMQYNRGKDNTYFYPATSFRYKNHMTILKALKYISEKGYNNYNFIFTLKKDENALTRKMYKYVKKNNLHVEFRGQLPRNEVMNLYSKTTLVFPSSVESYGLPLIEAKSSNSPIFAVDLEYAHEVLEDYNNVLYFKENDYKKLGEYIIDDLVKERNL